MKKLPRPLLFIIAAILVAFLVAGGYLLWRYIELRGNGDSAQRNGANQRVVVSNVCTDDIVSKVSSPLAENDISATRAVAEDILKKDNYFGDANCGYILTRFYLMTGQVDKAAEALDAMESARAAGSEYSLAFNPPVMPVADLRSALEMSRDIEVEKNKSDLNADELNKMDEEWQKRN